MFGRSFGESGFVAAKLRDCSMNQAGNAEPPAMTAELLRKRRREMRCRMTWTLIRFCGRTRAGQEAYFQQSGPHPDPLPSDGRGNSQTHLSQLPKRLDMPTDGGRFSLSHPMGEGRGEGEFGPKSKVVFAWVLSFAGRQKSFLRLVSRGFPGLESTLQIVKLRERQVTHLVAGLCAAHPSAAVHQVSFVLLQPGHFLRKIRGVHVDVDRAGNMPRFKFLLGA